MKGVEIIKLDILKNDSKGTMFEFYNRDNSKILLIKRKAGTISGGHYHTGKNKFKNPETIILIDGKFEILLRNIKTLEEFNQNYDYPVMIKIAPYIYHKIINLTDTIIIDMNSFKDDDDTIKV